METRGNTAQIDEVQLEAQLHGLLTGALLDAPDEIGLSSGRAPLEAEKITTDFLPPNKKIILTYEGETESSPDLYYIKTDAHDPRPFHMPDGKLRIGEQYDVTSIAKSVKGLVLGIGYQGMGNDFFYANSLDGLTLNVIEKSDAEKAQDQLREIRSDIRQHDYFVSMASKYKEGAEELAEAVQELPVFEVDSPNRYCVDSSRAGTLYRVDEEASSGPEFIQSWTIFSRSAPAGKFFGNRFAVKEGKMLLVDDETGLALGVVIVEERNGAVGFDYLEAVDTSTINGSRDNSALNQRLLEAAS